MHGDFCPEHGGHARMLADQIVLDRARVFLDWSPLPPKGVLVIQSTEWRYIGHHGNGKYITLNLVEYKDPTGTTYRAYYGWCHETGNVLVHHPHVQP